MTNITEQVLFISSIDREKSGISKCEDFVIKFNPALKLPTSMKHEIAVDKVSMTYSWHNISPKYQNNTIKYSHDNGQSWNLVTFPSGMYSYDDLNDYLHEVMKVNKHSSSMGGVEEFGINLRFILSTYKIVIILMNNFQVDLRNTKFNELIGFEQEIISTTKMAVRLPNITNSIDTLHINTSIINDSIVGGQKSNTLIVIPTDNLIRSRPFSLEPKRALYNIISTNLISNIRFNITDSIRRPVNLNGIDWHMTLIIRSTSL